MYVSPIIECSMLSTYTPSFINILTREYSLLGEVSLYGRSPVVQVYIQLLHYIQITDTNPVLLNWRPAVR